MSYQNDSIVYATAKLCNVTTKTDNYIQVVS